MAAGDPCNHKAQLQHKATPPPPSLFPLPPHSRASTPSTTLHARAMYQFSSYPDPFLRPLFSAFPSQAPLQPPSPPPASTHHHGHHSLISSYHLYPPSPPHRASLAPSAGAGGGFLGPAASPSLPSSFLQSSGSSADSVLSLHNHLLERSHHHCNGGGGGMNGSAHLYDQHDYFDFPSAMQATNSLRPLPGAESCTQEVGGAGGAAAMAGGRVGRYTAEERKERIERYRSKRNHRNFQKKITYACRKTLADSRPRVRGRFARNGEAEPEPEAEAGEVSSCNNSSSQSGGEYCFGWRPAADDEDEYGGDPDFWDNFLDTMSMNNPMIYS